MDEFRQGVDDTTINHGLLKLLKFSQKFCKSLSFFCLVLFCLCVGMFSKWFEVFSTEKELMLEGEPNTTQ